MFSSTFFQTLSSAVAVNAATMDRVYGLMSTPNMSILNAYVDPYMLTPNV
jgi:hypothetical protein